MIFTCETKGFLDALNVAGRVVPAKGTYPIILSVKINASDSGITMTATNMDTTHELSIAADVTTDGEWCIPFAALSKFVIAAKATTVTVSVDGKIAQIKSGRSRITLHVNKGADFPIQTPAESEFTAVDGPTFCDALRFCYAATSTEEARYYLQGVSFDNDDPDLTLWGTNGHCMHRATLPGMGSKEWAGILHRDAVQSILAVSAKVETIHFFITEKGWGAIAGPTRMWGKVIDGTFPDVRRVTSGASSFAEVASVEVQDLTNGVAVASVGSNVGSERSLTIALRGDGDTLTINGVHPSSDGGVRDAGQAEVDASIREPFFAGLNAKYLTAALTGFGGERVKIRASNEMFVVEPAQDSATSQFTSLIMQIRIQETAVAA